MHANRIGDIKELEHLKPLTQLLGLSLHGNPIEADPQSQSARRKPKPPTTPRGLGVAPTTPRGGSAPGAARAEYRFAIALALPSLKKLDFSPLTILVRARPSAARSPAASIAHGICTLTSPRLTPRCES